MSHKTVFASVGLTDQTTDDFNLSLVSNSDATILTDHRTVTIDVNNADRVIDFKGDLSLGGDFTTTSGNDLTFITTGDTIITLPPSGTMGDVVGPASATDNALARFDGTTGKLIQNGTVTQTDTGTLQNVEALDFTLTASNPGTSTTLWQSSDNNHLYRGESDIENIFEYKKTFLINKENAQSRTSLSGSGNHLSIGYPNLNKLYVFRKEGWGWEEEQLLTPSLSAVNYGIYSSFDYNANRLAVGDRDARRVYIYVRNGSTWTEEQVISQTTQLFGTVAILNYDHNILIVGQPAPSGGTSRIYIYERTGTVWSSIQTISYPILYETAWNMSMTMDAERFIADSARNDADGTDTGSAYVYKKNSGANTWSLEQRLQVSPLVNSLGLYGCDISDDGTFAAVTLWTQVTDGFTQSGALYIFKRNGTVWTEIQKIINPFPETGARFGSNPRFNYDATVLLTCAPGEGNPTDSGTVYTYRRGSEDKFYLMQRIKVENPVTGETSVSRNVCYDGQCLVISNNSGDAIIYRSVSESFVKNHSTSEINNIPIFRTEDGALLQDSTVNITNGEVSNIEALTLNQNSANPGGTDTLWINSADGHVYRDSVDLETGGDVVGPASATDNALARFNLTTGKLIKDSSNFIFDGTTASIASSGNVLDIQNTTDSSSNQVAIIRSGNRTSPTDNDEGYISFHNDDDLGTQTEFSRLSWVATDVTNTSKDAQLEFDVMVNNVLTNTVTVNGSGIDIQTSGTLSIGGISILSDSSGTTTLNNIDALDATTETTIETAIDTLTGLTTLSINDVTTSAYDLALVSDSDGTVLTADRSLTFDVNNADRTIDLGGNLTLGNDLTTTPGNAITLTTTGTTNVTLPTSGTLLTSEGHFFKNPVRLATTANMTNGTNGIASGFTYTATGGASGRGQIVAVLSVSDVFTVDGVNLGAADNNTRILLKDQTTGAQNGIWTTTISGTGLTLDRATDFDEDNEVVANASMFVSDGDTNADYVFTLTTNNPITIGGGSGTSLAFSYFGSNYNITVVNASSYTIVAHDRVILVDHTGTAPVTVNLPSASIKRRITVTDSGGNSSVNNITISRNGGDTILGATTFVLSGDYNSVNLFSDGGTRWFAGM